jgi:hypothetical protein
VKIAFIRLYGQPHRIDTLAGEESVFWGGNKAQIYLGVFSNGGNFGFSPGSAVTRLTKEKLPLTVDKTAEKRYIHSPLGWAGVRHNPRERRLLVKVDSQNRS